MKHALLITAYKNPHHLVALAENLDDRFRLYIHIDKKSSFSTDEIIALEAHPRVAHVVRKYKVNWAGINHLRALLHLLEVAIESKGNSHFHTLSGQDFPIQSSNQIINFFENNSSTQFMENFSIPAGHWTHGGMHRIWHFYFFDWFNHKSKFGNFVNRGLNKLQRIAGFKRKWPAHLPPLHGGGSWLSVPRDCATYIVNYNEEHPEFLKRLRFTLCPEELFFQTIIMNSEFAHTTVSDHLRYIDWAVRNGNSPANLDESDLVRITASEKIFARKFEYPVSEILIKQIKEKINS